MEKQQSEVFYKKAVVKNLAIFTGKQLCWSLFLTLNIAKVLKAPILKGIIYKPDPDPDPDPKKTGP